MRIFVSLLLMLLIANAEFKVGDRLPSFELKDQFDNKLIIDESILILVLATNKESGKIAHAYFESKPATFFEQKKLIYISDMSLVPSFVLDMFMMGSFKKYPYSLGLLKDEKIAKEMPKKENQITIFFLNKLQIESILFAKDINDLKNTIERD